MRSSLCTVSGGDGDVGGGLLEDIKQNLKINQTKLQFIEITVFEVILLM